MGSKAVKFALMGESMDMAHKLAASGCANAVHISSQVHAQIKEEVDCMPWTLQRLGGNGAPRHTYLMVPPGGGGEAALAAAAAAEEEARPLELPPTLAPGPFAPPLLRPEQQQQPVFWPAAAGCSTPAGASSTPAGAAANEAAGHSGGQPPRWQASAAAGGGTVSIAADATAGPGSARTSAERAAPLANGLLTSTAAAPPQPQHVQLSPPQQLQPPPQQPPQDASPTELSCSGWGRTRTGHSSEWGRAATSSSLGAGSVDSSSAAAVAAAAAAAATALLGGPVPDTLMRLAQLEAQVTLQAHQLAMADRKEGGLQERLSQMSRAGASAQYELAAQRETAVAAGLSQVQVAELWGMMADLRAAVGELLAEPAAPLASSGGGGGGSAHGSGSGSYPLSPENGGGSGGKLGGLFRRNSKGRRSRG